MLLRIAPMLAFPPPSSSSATYSLAIVVAGDAGEFNLKSSSRIALPA